MLVVRVNRWQFKAFLFPPGRQWWRPYWHRFSEMLYWLHDGEKPCGLAIGACRVGLVFERISEDAWEGW